MEFGVILLYIYFIIKYEYNELEHGGLHEGVVYFEYLMLEFK